MVATLPNVRVAEVLATALLCVGIGACSAGGGSDSALASGPDKTCTLISQLAATADTVNRADIADPEKFNAALDDAVAKYVRTIDDLRRAVPSTLRESLDRLQAAVEQYDFDEALAARAPLDEYGATHCSAATTTTTE
jgi:hypothetical protein